MRKPLGLALGNFDGVHRGHQVILGHLVRHCKAHRWTPAVYTFAPHPAKVLSPQTAPPLIQTPEQKRRALQSAGIQKIIAQTFDRKFSRLSPEAFFEKILVKKLNAAGVWVGHDFTFGRHRSGDVEKLSALCQRARIVFHKTSPRFAGATLVSSTQIRSLVALGKVDRAAALLGRPFALIGKVVRGAGIGGKLGIHTANLKVENELLPKIGIYITKTHIEPRTTCPSVTSVGFNPTFPGKGFSVETHLIGFKGNLRGKKIEVDFLKWLREELTFPNEETLAAQIQKDITAARRVHQALRTHRRPD